MTHNLVDGFKVFRRKHYQGNDPLMPYLVKEGQDPDYFIISCIDSRANPGTIFSPNPGSFFAHKAMGAIVRPYKKGTALSAGLQFALDYNNVKKIIVCGHTGCGAVNALITRLDDPEISEFIDVARHCICGTQRETEERIVLESVKNLKGYPSVAKALAENRVTIKPWLFEMEMGHLLEYNTDSGKFEVLV